MYTNVPCKAPVSVMNEMLVTVADVLGGFCLFVGAMIIVGALYQWTERRKNPSAITMTRIFTLLIVGIALSCIQFVPMLRVV